MARILCLIPLLCLVIAARAADSTIPPTGPSPNYNGTISNDCQEALNKIKVFEADSSCMILLRAGRDCLLGGMGNQVLNASFVGNFCNNIGNSTCHAEQVKELLSHAFEACPQVPIVSELLNLRSVPSYLCVKKEDGEISNIGAATKLQQFMDKIKGSYVATKEELDSFCTAETIDFAKKTAAAGGNHTRELEVLLALCYKEENQYCYLKMKAVLAGVNPLDKLHSLMDGPAEFVAWNEQVCNSVCLEKLEPILPIWKEMMPKIRKMCIRNPSDGHLCYSAILLKVLRSDCVKCVKKQGNSCVSDCLKLKPVVNEIKCCMSLMKNDALMNVQIPGVTIDTTEECSATKNITVEFKLNNLKNLTEAEFLQLKEKIKADLIELGDNINITRKHNNGTDGFSASATPLSDLDALHKNYEVALAIKNKMIYFNQTNTAVSTDMLEDPTSPVEPQLMGAVPEKPSDYPSLLGSFTESAAAVYRTSVFVAVVAAIFALAF